MKIVDIANEIYIDAGSPTDTSIPAIAFWIRGKVGWLNTMVYEDLIVDPTTLELTDNGTEINTEMVSLIKQLYKVYDLDVMIRNTINSLLSDGILQVTDNLGGTSFVRANRNEMAKTLMQVRKDEIQILNQMINSYRSLTSQPSQVAGDDTMVGYVEIYPTYHPLLIRRY